MNKILFIICMILVCGAVYCKDYSFSTDKVSITLTQEDKTVYFSSIINKNTNTECIRKEIGKKNNIWAFQVKKSREYASDPIDMFPTDAEKLIVKNGNKIVLTWKNVRKPEWKSGFDVIVTGEKSGDETLWHIKINSKTEEYGIWQVNFPFVTVRFEDGDEAFCGLFGGDISHENKPGKRISGHGYNDLPWCPYPVGDMPMQLFYFTQKGSGVYLCPEDTEGWHKHFKAPALGDKEVEYNLELYPNDQGVGGVSYSQAYKFNICAFDGDWFDGVKKYRAWGIKAGAAPFARGRIADRKDFPEWVRKNVYWGNDYQKLIAGNVETAFHLYAWWNWPHDEGYPEMLPAKQTSLDHWLPRFKKANQNFVFYTNCHLIDTAASELYKKYGDSIVNLDEKLERKKFHWGTGSNAATCPSLDILHKTAIDLNTFLVKEYGSDGVYLDELTMIEPEPCFNKDHGHPVGTGNRWVKEYSELMNEIMESASKVSDKPIVIFSEGTAEPYPCDMELDLQTNADRPYGKAAYYSGYRIIWGMQYNPYDFEPSQQPGIAKMAYTLCGGWQLGWYQYMPTGKDYKDYPEFTKYQLGACKAREYAIDYLSMGEFVRQVKITNDIPYVDTPVEMVPNENSRLQHLPSVMTSSWNLDGKTMILFTNITNESQLVKWESTAKDLYLENDRLYTIQEEYPVKKDMGKGYNEIKSQFIINPLETVIVTVK